MRLTDNYFFVDLGPNFVSSLVYGDYVYFFYRETAVEYMNCGKVSFNLFVLV